MDWLLEIPVFGDVERLVVVDGGGTRSRAAVATGTGELLGYAEGGPTNSRSAGDQDAARNVAQVIASALEAAGVAEVGAVLVSSASVDTAAHAAVLEAGVRQTVGTAATVSVVADTIGCWAATAALAPAVAVIAGTGSAVLAGTLGQRSQRYGGWDYVLGDEGSGYAMGRAVLREALLVSEGRSNARALSDACWSRLNITEIDELFDVVYKPEIDKSYVASFAEDLLAAAAAGDERGGELVDEQVGLLADTVAAAFSSFTSIDTLGCFGGIWNDTGYRERFGNALEGRLGRAPTIVFPGDVAMAGSFRLVIRHGPQGRPGPAEDGAVEQFTAALVAAKAARS